MPKKKALYLVFSEPTEGMEEEYNRWYDNVHLKQVVETPGIVAAQRFKIAKDDSSPDAPPEHYLAVYEIDSEMDPVKVTAQLATLYEQGKLDMSESIDFNNTKTWVFEAIGEKIIKK